MFESSSGVTQPQAGRRCARSLLPRVAQRRPVLVLQRGQLNPVRDVARPRQPLRTRRHGGIEFTRATEPFPCLVGRPRGPRSPRGAASIRAVQKRRPGQCRPAARLSPLTSPTPRCTWRAPSPTSSTGRPSRSMAAPPRRHRAATAGPRRGAVRLGPRQCSRRSPAAAPAWPLGVGRAAPATTTGRCPEPGSCQWEGSP